MQQPSPSRWNTLSYLQVVLLVGVAVATLFTAWTDPSLLPSGLGEQIALGVAPQTSATAAAEAANRPSPTPRGRPLVGIVVGHWDDQTGDPGAVCLDIPLTELMVNQEIAARVQTYLLAENIAVELLREFDDRLEGYRADALVSIHADSCDYVNDQATGYKVSGALSNPNPEMTARLVTCMKDRYAQATGLREHPGYTFDMTEYHAFYEIDSATSAVIVEIGFLNRDRDLITRQPDLIAQGIRDGILCYLNNEEVVQPTRTPGPSLFINPEPTQAPTLEPSPTPGA